MKKLFVFSLLALISSSIQAQTAEEEVKAVIESLFDGMRAKNTEMIASAFDPKALMQTIVVSENGAETRSNAVQDFVARIGQSPAETQLDERITDYQIKVDGDLASAWTPYEFYVNGEFSHCGVNSFQLVRMAEGWKIVYIIDTRRKEDCV
ncbi:nuclear transport factor 2 family protein [Algoriphagus sediminis]|uniref:Nuclear transport factor 2 family protein n=1 Tax=Algoriphagus sediminis TaxID=3057113 RepID=A0ABT7YEX0_9BACT|nr:nuclear transport factor 2 family protein [Algoriphagus sediminis]MDN3205072.1 nuclear transport factor 2 family protein [Algoriphagus sediminis]